MVTEAILTEIKRALDSPTDYGSGKNKNQLRAAFDAFCSQIYSDIFGQQPLSRMNARQTLIASKKEAYSEEQWKLIVQLREAIKVSEYTLHAKDYLDHTQDIQQFINSNVRHLYDAIT